MSVRQKDTASEQSEIKIGSSWIPETSAKATSTNRGENQTAQASLSGSEEFVQQTQCQRASMSVNNASRVAVAMATNSRVYEENLIGIESWVAREAANSHMFGKGSMNGPDQWSNVSFRSLLNVIGTTGETGNALTQSNFARSSSPQVEGRQFTTSSGSTSLQDQHTMLGANFDAQGRILNTDTGKFTI